MFLQKKYFLSHLLVQVFFLRHKVKCWNKFFALLACLFLLFCFKIFASKRTVARKTKIFRNVWDFYCNIQRKSCFIQMSGVCPQRIFKDKLCGATDFDPAIVSDPKFVTSQQKPIYSTVLLGLLHIDWCKYYLFNFLPDSLIVLSFDSHYQASSASSSTFCYPASTV